MTLLDFIPDPATLARAEHPATSHQAAAEVAPHVGALERWAAARVAETPGLTASELEARHGPMPARKLGKRLCGCERRGLVRRGGPRACTVSGRSATTWFPVE